MTHAERGGCSIALVFVQAYVPALGQCLFGDTQPVAIKEACRNLLNA